MGKLEITDDCLSPERYIYLTYSGPDPWEVVKKISDAIRGFFHVSASGTNHERLNWDDTSDPITYWSLWWVRKKMSGMSAAYFRVWVQGTKSKVDNTGQFTMRIHGDLKTKIFGPQFILKPFWMTYSYLFYNAVRQRFLERCRNLAFSFRNEIKEHYNLSVTTVPEGHTVFK